MTARRAHVPFLAMPSLEFTNLPLHEVSIRLAAQPPLRLDLGILFSLARRVASRFPDVSDALAPELVPGRGHAIVRLSNATDALALGGDPSGITVVVQSQVVVVRWQREGDVSAYPRYRAMRDRLTFFLDALRDTLGERDISGPTFDVAAFTYVNAVERPENACTEAALRILSPDLRPRLVPPNQPFHEFVVSWKEPPVDVRVELRSGTLRTARGDTPVYLLVSSAGKRLDGGEIPEAATDTLHDHLQGFFDRIISNDVKEAWGHVAS